MPHGQRLIGWTKITMWNRIGLSYKLGPIIFQKICQMQCKGNLGMAAVYIYQVRTPNAIHCLHVVGTTLYSMSKSKSQERFYSAYQHKCYAVACSQSVFKPDWTLWDEIKDDVMKYNICQQLLQNLINPSWGFGLVILRHLSTTAFIQCTRDMLL